MIAGVRIVLIWSYITVVHEAALKLNRITGAAVVPVWSTAIEAVVLVLYRENTSVKAYLMHETTCNECVSTSNREIRRCRDEARRGRSL